MKVLIVEDEADQRVIMRCLLEQHGCEVLEAQDGKEGLEMAAKHRPDAIISDGLMPVMDGFQFLRFIKQDDTLKAIPFVFYSAIYAGQNEAKLALSLGAEALIAKPKEPEEFWKEFDRIIGTSRLKEKPGKTTAPSKDKAFLMKYSEIVATKLEEKVKELEKANRAKTEFMANMSHEMRTPMNSIIGFSEVMLQGLTGDINEQQRESLENILKGGRRLMRLIENILDFSNIEAGRMELELGRFHLKDVLKASIAELDEKADKRGISLALDMAPEADLEMEADQGILGRIMSNLLSNAVKFTPEGGSVRVCARKVRSLELGVESKNNITPELLTLNSKRDGDFMEISVFDTGIGISPEDMKRLFQPFQQLEAPWHKSYEGTGLGLALTKKLVEMLGGEIRAESEPGRGSRFSFVIPTKTENRT